MRAFMYVNASRHHSVFALGVRTNSDENKGRKDLLGGKSRKPICYLLM